MEVRKEARRTAKARKYGAVERESWYHQFLRYGDGKEYNNVEGWAAHKYKTKFGEWPDDDFTKEREEPTAECLSWIRGMNLRYVYAKKAMEKKNETNNEASSTR